jgi:hypothetical protein
MHENKKYRIAQHFFLSLKFLPGVVISALAQFFFSLQDPIHISTKNASSIYCSESTQGNKKNKPKRNLGLIG